MAKRVEVTQLPRVRFFYIKANGFRVAHVDGAIGGLTPRGMIHASVYSERAAIPQMIEQELGPDGTLGEVATRHGKDGIVRELEIDLVMTEDTAIAMRDWLTLQIVDLQAARAQGPARQKRAKPRGGKREGGSDER